MKKTNDWLISLAGFDYISMLSAKPAMEATMPVSLHLESNVSEQLLRSINRIIKDLDESHWVNQTVNEWLQSPTTFQLWLGEFNQRVISFALVKDSEIKALVVHAATRNRGVGKRMLTLLVSQNPTLHLAKQSVNPGLVRHFEQIERPNKNN